MKLKAILIALCIAALFSSCISQESNLAKADSKGNTEVVKIFDAAYINDIERVNIAVKRDGSMHIVDAKEIYFLDKDGDRKKVISDPHSYFTSVIVEENKLFTLASDGVLKQYDDKYTLIKESQMIPINMKESYTVQKLVFLNNKIYSLLHDNKNANNFSIWEYDLVKNSMQELKNEQVLDFAKYKDGKLLVFTKSVCCGGHIFIYDPVSMKKIEEFEIRGMSSRADHYYNVKEDVLYEVEQGSISIIPMSERKKKDSHAIGNIPFYGKQFAFTDNIGVFIDKVNKKIVKVDTSALSNTISLTVLINPIEFESYFRTAVIDFGLQNPGINIVFKGIGDEYSNTLNTKVLSGDNDFDIFLLSSDKVHSYLKKGGFEDLGMYPSIKNSFMDMFDGIEELCSYNDKIFGIPVGMFSSEIVYKLNTGLLERLKLDAPRFDWTWNEFEKIGQSLSKNNTYIMKNDTNAFWIFGMQWVYDSICVNMAEGTTSYKVQDIEERLELMKKYYEQNLILNYDRLKDKENEEGILLHSTTIPGPDLNKMKIIPVPVFEGKEAYPFYINFLCINKNSKNKEMAAAFLEKCISKETQGKDGVTGVPVLYRDKAIYEKSMYKDFFNNEWNYQVYSYMMNHSRRLETHSLYNNFISFVEEYMKGNLTSKEAAQKIYDKMMIVVKE